MKYNVSQYGNDSFQNIHFFQPTDFDQEAKKIDTAPSVCQIRHMATNLKIDDKLLKEALDLSGFSTKKATVNEALKAYIRHLKQLKALAFEGQFEEFDHYDHKAYRQ